MGTPEDIGSAGLDFSQHCLELGKYLLNRVVVRQAFHDRASLLDGGAHASDLWALRLPITRMSLGRSSGTRNCSTQLCVQRIKELENA